MNLDQYMAAQRGAEIETPVAVKVGGKTEVVSLNRILYGPPPPESERRKVKRMADLIVSCVTSSGGITREQLLGNFDAAEIDRHFAAARRLAGLHRLGGTL
jgi:hypothetical protein